jgi:hypothetical protein
MTGAFEYNPLPGFVGEDTIERVTDTDGRRRIEARVITGDGYYGAVLEPRVVFLGNGLEH